MANWYDWLNPIYTGTQLGKGSIDLAKQIGTQVGSAARWFDPTFAGSQIGNTISGMTNSAVDAQEKFNADQAQLQRDWEERMSNTAYQRAVDDLKAAGLNPWLAVQNGGVGASTPSGASASSSSSSATKVYGLSKMLGIIAGSWNNGMSILGNMASSALKILG